MTVALHRAIGRVEFDYPALMGALAHYAKPHDRVTQLLGRGEIVRVKKGIYLLGAEYRDRPFSRELLANLIHGPSFVSLDYALAFHGLVTERVEQVTSVTPGRPRAFATPVGRFVYRPVPAATFHLGMELVLRGPLSFLIATPERALVDRVREDRRAPVRSVAEAGRYLLEDLRLDEGGLARMDPEQVALLAAAMRSRKAQLCARFLAAGRRKG